MVGFEGNKTLAPLEPGGSPYNGRRPILLHIISSLPKGPKAVVVHYKKEEIIRATRGFDITYCEQPTPNGTGGALLAARSFFERVDSNELIITMGDTPFVRTETYLKLVENLNKMSLVVLGFQPVSKRRYGVLELEGKRVRKIIEWQYWKHYPSKRQQLYPVCNSGIYGVRKDALLPYLSVLASRPHRVTKAIDGKPVEAEEYFITDLVEYMHSDGLTVGYVLADGEDEVMGVDDLDSLLKAQELFRMGKA
jgi:bifunctional UDP-N-acetylglucosamine pyrophosphorylase/glucosamine-1-phosphate N-acetyltransferase